VGHRQFGRYRVTGTLGTGAMGDVYSAVDDVLGREVAIKTLKSASGVTARMLDDRFRQEARAIAQLSHSGVVQVFDLDLAAEPPFLVMERVAGPSLATRLDGGPPLGAGELVPLGIQIARALAAAHAAGIVHRDVKPANILAAGERAWKLADFGVAHVPDSSLTITGQFVGSPAYAPPEALLSGVAAAAGDVYGLGATLYEAAAGRWPRAEAKGALLAPVPPLATLAPHLPRSLAAAIDRAVSLEHARRPSAAELAELIAGSGTSQVLAARPRAPIRQGRLLAIAIGALAVVLVVAVATRGGSPASAPAADEVVATPPPNLTGKAAKEWDHVVEEVHRGHVDGARHHLDDFERRFGATAETRALRDQLDALPPERPPHPRDE
jgi:serine/threonine-protein kinase